MEKVKEIIFAENISPDSIKRLIDQCTDHNKIRIYLNSNGGDPNSAFAFHEYIRVNMIDLHVHVLNICMSAAITILCAAKKRTASQYSRFLFHPAKRCYKDIEMVEEELSLHTKDLKIIILSYNQIVGQTVNKTAEEIESLCKGQTLLNTTEALELGLLTQATFETELVTRSTK